MLGFDINIVEAKGTTLTDVNGKKFIDLISGISVSSLGHCHPKVVDAIKKQAEKYMHLMVYGEFNQYPQVQYAQTLTSLLPKNLSCIYYTTGGSEAIEGAMKLSKRFTGRSEFIAFKNSYHGSTQGSLSLMHDEAFKNAFRPLLPDVIHLHFNHTEELSQITEKTAAVVIEPIQAEAGVIEAEKDFLHALRKRCSETGTLLVFDEIQTGFARTGKLFAFEHYDVIPDILCIAKGMGGGMPIGAFIASHEIMHELTHKPILGHINTFGGNAVCVTAAQACIEVIIHEKLWENALMIESIIKDRLKHPLIQHVNIKGALCAVHLKDESLNFNVCKKILEKGVIVDWFLFCSNAIRIAPPLIIEKEELIKACQIIIEALDSQ